MGKHRKPSWWQRLKARGEVRFNKPAARVLTNERGDELTYTDEEALAAWNERMRQRQVWLDSQDAQDYGHQHAPSSRPKIDPGR
jgi:hypothetical protein